MAVRVRRRAVSAATRPFNRRRGEAHTNIAATVSERGTVRDSAMAWVLLIQ